MALTCIPFLMPQYFTMSASWIRFPGQPASDSNSYIYPQNMG